MKTDGHLHVKNPVRLDLGVEFHMSAPCKFNASEKHKEARQASKCKLSNL
jgi:hypothetical protein